MGTETAFVLLIIYMFYMLHLVHDLRSKLTALQSQFASDREHAIASFIDSLVTGDLNSAVESYQRLSGCTQENAKIFVESLRQKNESDDLTSEPAQS
jgi:hypothetical protein